MKYESIPVSKRQWRKFGHQLTFNLTLSRDDELATVLNDTVGKTKWRMTTPQDDSPVVKILRARSVQVYFTTKEHAMLFKLKWETCPDVDWQELIAKWSKASYHILYPGQPFSSGQQFIPSGGAGFSSVPAGDQDSSEVVTSGKSP